MITVYIVTALHACPKLAAWFAPKCFTCSEGAPAPSVSSSFAQIQHDMACNSYGITVHWEGMRIRSGCHRGLKRFIEDDDDRAGTWSVPVSGNWRITFTLDSGEICNPNLEDYH
jgi:hypothetical protein